MNLRFYKCGAPFIVGGEKMKICLNTDGLQELSFEKMLDTAAEIGVESLEIATGNWSPAPHIDLDEMIQNEDARKRFMDAIERRGLTLEILNCSGNSLDPREEGRRHQEVIEKTFCLAEMLGIKKIVMMSGLPGGGPDAKYPTWVTLCWPPIMPEMLAYQWEEVLIPYWEKMVKRATSLGIEKIALENHGAQCVYNAETFWKLRNEVGEVIGMNLDPSHLLFMGGDGIDMARALGKEAIYHVHAKDCRKEKQHFAINGGLETKPIEQCSERAWNYVALGYGQDDRWWKEFISVLSMIGYEGPISMEIEDMTMPLEVGVRKSCEFLKRVMPRVF